MPCRRVRDGGLVAASGLAMLAIFIGVRTSITDDAYITLSYARNLALDLHWGLIPDETANTATSPLAVVVLAAATAVTRIFGDADAVIGLGAVSVLSAMGLAWGWLRLQRALALPLWTAAIGIALVLVDPFFLSSVGLETVLIPTLVVGLTALALEGRPVGFGLVAALALLTRVDLVVFVLIIGVASSAIRRSWPRVLVVTLLLVAPWYLFSWIVLGSAVPDTLALKLAQRDQFPFDFFSGLVDHAEVWPAATATMVVPAVIGGLIFFACLGARLWRTRAELVVPMALAAAGLAYYGVYAAMRLPAYHWYYVPPMAALSTFLMITIGLVARGESRFVATRALVRPVLVAGAVALVLGRLAVDLDHGVPWRVAAISTNWATPAEYTRIGADVRRRIGESGVIGPGEIGTLAYSCRCNILDGFSDRGRAVPTIDIEIDFGSVRQLLFTANYAWLGRPEPRPAPYRLLYLPGGTSPSDVGLPGRTSAMWHVSTPWRGPGTFRLVKLRVPPRRNR